MKICLVNFFVFVNFHALLPTFPFFITHIGGDSVAIGLATALFSLASIVSRPFVGWLVDTKGRCTMLVVGLAGMALIPMGYFVAAGIAMAVMLRTLHGAFHAASSNAASTWVTDIVPQRRMGEGLGMYGLSMALSTAVAPALGLAVMNEWGFRPLFGIATLTAVVALLLGVVIKNRDYSLSDSPLRMSELFERVSLPASVTQFFFMIAYGVVEVYVAIYATGHGLPGGGVYFIFIAVATVLTRLALGRAIDRYGEANLVYSGNAAIVAGILLLVFAHNTPCYLLSALLLGYSFGAIQPSLQTMAMHAVTPERRGAANSTFFVAFDFGIALGGFMAGLLIKYFGYDLMFLVIALSCVLSAAYYHVFGRRHVSSFNPKNRIHPTPATAPDAELPRVITISREYGSGGHRIGELLAQRLGVKLYDKELIAMTASEGQLPEDTVEGGEQSAGNAFAAYDPVQAAIFGAQERVIRELASREPCVIVGRLANFILEGRANCFNIFIYAEPAYRIGRITSERGVSADRATQMMHEVDKERAEHCLHHTGRTWGDYRHYDLMLNSSRYGEERAAQMVYEIVSSSKRI